MKVKVLAVLALGACIAIVAAISPHLVTSAMAADSNENKAASSKGEMNKLTPPKREDDAKMKETNRDKNSAPTKSKQTHAVNGQTKKKASKKSASGAQGMHHKDMVSAKETAAVNGRVLLAKNTDKSTHALQGQAKINNPTKGKTDSARMDDKNVDTKRDASRMSEGNVDKKPQLKRKRVQSTHELNGRLLAKKPDKTDDARMREDNQDRVDPKKGEHEVQGRTKPGAEKPGKQAHEVNGRVRIKPIPPQKPEAGKTKPVKKQGPRLRVNVGRNLPRWEHGNNVHEYDNDRDLRPDPATDDPVVDFSHIGG